jgi:hypothetical protein
MVLLGYDFRPMYDFRPLAVIVDSIVHFLLIDLVCIVRSLVLRIKLARLSPLFGEGREPT